MGEAGVPVNQRMAEVIANHADHGVSGQGSGQAASKCSPGIEGADRAGDAGRDDRHFFGDRQTGSGEDQDHDDSQVRNMIQRKVKQVVRLACCHELLF